MRSSTVGILTVLHLKWWLSHSDDFHFQFCPFILSLDPTGDFRPQTRSFVGPKILNLYYGRRWLIIYAPVWRGWLISILQFSTFCTKLFAMVHLSETDHRKQVIAVVLVNYSNQLCSCLSWYQDVYQRLSCPLGVKVEPVDVPQN